MWIIREQFPIFQNNPDLVYLDNASTTQKPQLVIDTMNNYITHDYANIHRGQYRLAEQSELSYMQSKKSVADLISVDFREIIYTYNATHASNILAQSLVYSYGLKQWDVVLIGMRDHHATIVPWQLLSKQFGFEIQFIALDKETGEIDWNALESQLYDNNIRVVICSQISNVTWKIYDIKKIHDCLSDNIFFAVDGSQAVPHFEVKVSELWCDAYFFTGHKMMGPTGIGILWIEKNQSRNLNTIQWWWGIIEDVTTTWCTLIRTADKFEPGTPNLIGAIGLWAACEFYKQYNIYDNIEKNHIMINAIYKKLLDHIWYDKVVWWWNDDGIGILSLNLPNYHEIGEKLGEQNICVRVWWHCAHILLSHFGIDHGVVRISPFAYTTEEDMQKMAEEVIRFVKL